MFSQTQRISGFHALGGILFSWIFLIFAYGAYAFVSHQGMLRHDYFSRLNPSAFEKRLPDLLLDNVFGELLSSQSNPIYGKIGTLVALSFPILFNLVGLLTRQWRLLSQGNLLMGFVVMLNAVVQITTTVPSSYGLSRCQGMDLSALDGACSDMMWSGHVAHTHFGCIYLFRIIGTHWNLKSTAFTWVKFLFIGMALLTTWSLLILDQGHYTMDVLVAFLLTLSLATHPPLLRIVDSLNPCFPAEEYKELVSAVELPIY